MYNFGIPSTMKADIHNIVRVGRTFGFDRSRPDDPYSPTPNGKRLVILSARGDYGYAPGERMAHVNYVEPHLKSVFAFLGVNKKHWVAVEYDEFADDRLTRSLAEAEGAVERLVREITNGLDRNHTPAKLVVAGRASGTGMNPTRFGVLRWTAAPYRGWSSR